MIKTSNNIYAEHLMKNGRPANAPNRIALPVAGNDPQAVVMKLVDELGFDPVDTGGLDESWRQQPGTPVYKGDFNAEGVREGLAKVNRKRPSQFHATETSHATLC